MRNLPRFIFLVISIPAFGQADTTVVYYDITGKVSTETKASKFALVVKEADHYKKLMVDGADNKVEWIAYFTDADCKNFDGPYKSLHKNAAVNTTGRYVQNKKAGAWISRYDDGKLKDSVVYNAGYMHGLGLTWDQEGKVLDSLIFNEPGNGESHGYWSSGNPRQRGPYLAGKKNGLWIYYFKSGSKCQEVNYVGDSAVSYTCYDESGNVQKKDCFYEKEAMFPGGDRKWVDWLSKKLSGVKYPNEFYKGTMTGHVVVQCIVGVDGSIGDFKIIKSASPVFDKIAIDILKSSPKWIPAVQYNRLVKAYRKQPITFYSTPDE